MNPILPWAGGFDPAMPDEDLANAPSEAFTIWCEVHRNEPVPEELAGGLKERIIEYELQARATVRSGERPRVVREWRGNW